MAAWGTIWSFTLLVWTRPQWDARRVDIRRKQKSNGVGLEALHGFSNSSHLHMTPSGSDNTNEGCPPSTSGCSSARTEDNIEGALRKQVDQHNSQDIDVIEKTGDRASSSTLRERIQQPRPPSVNPTMGAKGQAETQLANGVIAGPEQEFEYYWQEYPDDGSFLTRISWAFDIVSTFRMTGKWFISPCDRQFLRVSHANTLKIDPLSFNDDHDRRRCAHEPSPNRCSCQIGVC